MITTVQISDFRKNLAGYLDGLSEGDELEIKRGGDYKAKVMAHTKKKKGVNMAENILKTMDETREKIKIRSKVKTMEELNNEIDRIVYGIDRKGKELSEADRQ